MKFIGVDQGICVDEAGADPTFACAGDAAALLPNYQGIVFAEEQPGYLAGIVAASISKTGIIGAVGGTNVPAVVAYNAAMKRRQVGQPRHQGPVPGNEPRSGQGLQ